MKVSHCPPYSWDVPPPLPEQSGWSPPGTRSSPKFPPSRLSDAFDQVVEPLIAEIT
jgi:hypothetical protein